MPNTAAVPKQARMTIAQKIELCRLAENGISSPTRLADYATDHFNLIRPLTEGGVRYVLSKKDSFFVMPDTYLSLKNLRRPAIIEFDAVLIELIEDFEEDDCITAEVAMELATYLAGELGIPPDQRAKFSRGWLQKFQRRNGLSFKRHRGEGASVDIEAANSGRKTLQDIIAGYTLEDVYNMDETSFYYRQRPAGSISRTVKAGHKKDKTRLTLAVAANADGSEKLPLLAIGKAMQPRDLKGHDVGDELDIDYTNSGKGWMTSEIYCDWLASVDDKMRAEGRHILLLVDNVSSHDDSTVTLTNIRVKPLPPNTTAILQPMDQGIIASLKKRYMEKKTMAALRAFLYR